MSHPHQTTPTTKSGTLTSSTEKKRGRPRKTEDLAVAAITDEDLALDRELDRIAKETPPAFEDKGENKVKVIKEARKNPLSDFIDDYRPAGTLIELDSQVFDARARGAESIEATPEMIRHLVGPNYEGSYIDYKGMRVYVAGERDNALANERMSMEERIFPKAK